MLLSRRAAEVARTSIRQHFQLRSLVTRLRGVEYRLPQVRLVPAACVSGLASDQSCSVFGELHQDYSMEDAVEDGPLAKRQRTGAPCSIASLDCLPRRRVINSEVKLIFACIPLC